MFSYNLTFKNPAAFLNWVSKITDEKLPAMDEGWEWKKGSNKYNRWWDSFLSQISTRLILTLILNGVKQAATYMTRNDRWGRVSEEDWKILVSSHPDFEIMRISEAPQTTFEAMRRIIRLEKLLLSFGNRFTPKQRVVHRLSEYLELAQFGLVEFHGSEEEIEEFLIYLQRVDFVSTDLDLYEWAIKLNPFINS